MYFTTYLVNDFFSLFEEHAKSKKSQQNLMKEEINEIKIPKLRRMCFYLVSACPKGVRNIVSALIITCRIYEE